VPQSILGGYRNGSGNLQGISRKTAAGLQASPPAYC
jgi:hypothetical protein